VRRAPGAGRRRAAGLSASASREAISAILDRGDDDALVAAARGAPGRVVRFLTGRLCSASEEEKGRAVRALGLLARAPGLLADDAVLELLRRFLWALNDESGAVPFGIPEAMGEILAARPGFRPAFLPILCGMLTEEEALQTGPVERGVIWAVGRVGPDALRFSPDLDRVLAEAAERHPDPETREEAVRALAGIRGEG